MDTNALIEHYAAELDLQELGVSKELLDAAIGSAIDRLYAARDASLSMHEAGAAVAVEVLKVVNRLASDS